MVESDDRTSNLTQGACMKLTLVNRQKLLEASKATRFGPDWPGQRCLAKTRRGTLCRNPAITDRNRCRMHGGKSTGPRSPQGKEKVRKANWKHGLRSRAHVAKMKQIRGDLKRVTRDLRQAGLIP